MQDRLDFFGREAEPLKEMEHDSGIERARSRAHAESVERREAEAAVDAPAAFQRAQARAASQVRDDHAAGGNLRSDTRQNRRDVLVREAVETVSLNPRRADVGRQRHEIDDRPVAAMKAGIEARDLRHVRQALGRPRRSRPGCSG